MSEMQEDLRCEGPSQRCGRRGECPLLDDKAMEVIAEKAADRAIAKLTATVYQEVGRGVISKLFYIVGTLVVALYLGARATGYIK